MQRCATFWVKARAFVVIWVLCGLKCSCCLDLVIISWIVFLFLICLVSACYLLTWFPILCKMYYSLESVSNTVDGFNWYSNATCNIDTIVWVTATKAGGGSWSILKSWFACRICARMLCRFGSSWHVAGISFPVLFCTSSVGGTTFFFPDWFG